MSRRGFTLIELMITVAVLGIFVAVGIPFLVQWRNHQLEQAPTTPTVHVRCYAGEKVIFDDSVHSAQYQEDNTWRFRKYKDVTIISGTCIIERR